MTTRPWRIFAWPAAVALWSAILPFEWPTWWMEAIPALLGLPLVMWLWPRFAWTRLACVLMALLAIVLLIGAHYSYARTPLGFYLQDWLDLSRNPYDRIGHLMQGFAPAILAREVLYRRATLRGRWLGFMAVCFCLAFSAFYELIEWWAALALGSGAEEFLATQGDVWDTQWDMFLALIGSCLSILLLGRMHARQLRQFD